MESGEELGKPSILATGGQFASISIALVHADPRGALVVKSVLDSLGCRAIMLARDGPDLLARLRREVIDIAVIDWNLRSVLGVETAAQLRMSQDSLARDIPIILLGPPKDQDAMAAARDAGINEYVWKPFTAKTLLASVHTIVNHPRPFIVSRDYAGPDRRDNPSYSALLPAGPPRKCTRRTTPNIARPGEATGGTKEPTLHPPDYRLKRKMGLKAPEHLTPSPDAVEQLEHTLTEAKSRFVSSVQAEVREIIAYNRLLLQKHDRADEIKDAIKGLASVIEARTSELGYRRIPEVARLLRDFCDKYFIPGNGRSLILLEKHALTLMAMLQVGQESDASPLGESLIRDLARQVAAFKDI